jgi:hypothetical protein
MSGSITQNPNRQSGTIGSIPSATKDSSNPTKTTNPSSGVGTEWINTTSGALFICTDATTNSNTWIAQTESPISIGNRGIWMGGTDGIYANEQAIYNSIDYISINTLCDSTLFGDLAARKYEPTGVSNGTNGRGVACGGLLWYTSIPGGQVNYDSMEYVTINTLGNVTDLGNMTSTYYSMSGCSNATNDRGILWGGQPAGGGNTHIDYFTITSTANAADFGDKTVATRYSAATDNGTGDRGVSVGGDGATTGYDMMEYVTISSAGNATDFGNLTQARMQLSATSNSVNNRGVVAGGAKDGTTYNIIDYFTINTTGNAIDFGDLTLARKGLSALSNGIGERGIFSSGDPVAGRQRMDYITINNTGNATVFGSMRKPTLTLGSASDCGT